jgi:hypothetical protein
LCHQYSLLVLEGLIRGGMANGVVDAWLYWHVFAEHTWWAISTGCVRNVHSPFHNLGSGPVGLGLVLMEGISTRERPP